MATTALAALGIEVGDGRVAAAVAGGLVFKTGVETTFWINGLAVLVEAVVTAVLRVGTGATLRPNGRLVLLGAAVVLVGAVVDCAVDACFEHPVTIRTPSTIVTAKLTIRIYIVPLDIGRVTAPCSVIRVRDYPI